MTTEKQCPVCWLLYHHAHKQCPDCVADGILKPEGQQHERSNH